MTTQTLSQSALSIIDQYKHFKVGSAVCSVPYFNNKTVRARAALRSTIGKGSPQEIFEEIKSVLLRDHVDESAITDESLKETLVDNNIGTDCSAFAYYILNAECNEHGKGKLEKHLHFANCHGLVGKIRCALRPIENCDVATLAHEKNSNPIAIKNVRPGDIITMIGGPDNSDRDHILVIHSVEYQDTTPTNIHYVHAIAYPEDGIYGSGIKQGMIKISDPEANIIEQVWMENNVADESNRLYVRAQKSDTSLRRLCIFIDN